MDKIEEYNTLKMKIRSESSSMYDSVAIDEMAKQALLKNAGGKK